MEQGISAKVILITIVLGIITGLSISHINHNSAIFNISYNIVDTISILFLRSLKMLVVPVVSISIMCGISQMENASKIGKIGIKTFFLYIITTAIAISMSMVLATVSNVGSGLSLGELKALELAQAPSLKETLISWVPDNAISAMVNNNMLQIILFATLIGIAMIKSGKKGEIVVKFTQGLNEVLMTWVMLIMQVVPIGVFCLMTKLSMTTGIIILKSLGLYAIIVIASLAAQVLLVYSPLLLSIGKRPWSFLKQVWPAQIFAFSVSSSSASIPVVLKIAREKLSIKDRIANFVIPLGATINMDGTAIMQGVATIFIANAYQIKLTTIDLITVMSMATLASVGTAGVPGIGLITLAMVLEQVGIPIAGIALIVGVDRILDMLRTAINITGDMVVALIIDRTENNTQ